MTASIPLKNANTTPTVAPAVDKPAHAVAVKAPAKKDVPPVSVKSPQLNAKKETYSPLQKTPQPHPKSPPTTAGSPPLQPPSPSQTQKKVNRRSSKPIINWFQRKLAGSGRTRRASEGHSSGRPSIPHFDIADAPPVPRRERSGHGVTGERPKSTPGPINTGKKDLGEVPPVPTIAKNTISLNEEDGERRPTSSEQDRASLPRSSLGPESMWSPSVAVEADEDASVRPIPPSAPPSPSPSHSSSSYMSDPRTFRSMAASTKPTTVLSVDLGNGMAHIAEAPPTPLQQVTRMPQHVRTSSLGTGGGAGREGSITFALPQPAPSVTTPSSANPASASPEYDGPLQAPQHTTHHPRDNPRPFSPPEDNASLLTLASSAFGVPGARIGANALTWNAAGASMMDVGDSGSTLPGAADSTSQLGLGEDEYGDREQNVSMRALRSRRSWESEASRWSARVGGTSLGPSTPAGERSLWAGTSLRTGTHYSFGEDKDEKKDEEEANGDVWPRRSQDGAMLRTSPDIVDGDADSNPATNGRLDSPFEERDDESERTSDDDQGSSHHDTATDVQATPQVSPRKQLPGDSTPDAPKAPPSSYFPNMEKVNGRIQEQVDDDTRSFMTGTDGQTDVWVSAPSTPLGWHQ